MKKIAIASLMALTLNLGAALDPKPVHIRALKTASKIASYAGAKLLVAAKYVGKGTKYVAKGVQSKLRSVDWEKKFPRTINTILYTSDKCSSFAETTRKFFSKVFIPPFRLMYKHTGNMINGITNWMAVDQH
jgi:hypothetical protein